MNTRTWKNRALATVLAGTTAIAAVSASAAPVLTGTAALKQALPSDVQDVRWGWGGGAFFGGLIAGGLIGAAIATPYYGYGYGYYSYPPYAYGYYAPYAYGYSYPYVSSGYAYPYGGYYGGGYYGGWRGYGWRGGPAHVGYHVRHY